MIACIQNFLPACTRTRCLQLLSLFSCFLFLSCSSSKEAKIPWQTIQGRDRTITQPLYQIRAPLTWRRVDPVATTNLSDTTLPILVFYIDDAAEPIRITLHTFPYNTSKERIPLDAQVARWQRQQQTSNPGQAAQNWIQPVAHGGFQGLFFEAKGVLAWAMKIGDPYEQFFQSQTEQTPHLRALRADYTIKATGPQEALENHRDELIAFARSFEWIEEMPHP